jgi:hypothetical protein
LRTRYTTVDTTQRETRKITLPYIKNISEMTARLLKQHGITVAYKPTNTLRRTLSKPKTQIKSMKRTNVVYQIQCNNCDKHYVGQTGRKLSTRVYEHQLAIRRHDPMSMVSLHEDQEGHQFNWNNVKILAQAGTKREREFIEAWYSTKNAINKHIDIDPIYQPLRNRTLQNNTSSNSNGNQTQQER